MKHDSEGPAAGSNANHKSEVADEKADNAAPQNDKEYPPMKEVAPAMLAIWLIFFLVALDRTIIGTAIPSITADFDSFGDVAWYESAFLLPLCILQLSFGLVLKYYSTKWVLFTLSAIFEIGSIVCATAPTSNALIVGRAITGIGGAGIGPGAFLFITLLIPLRDRPKFLGSLGSAFGVSSILGPICGGYLTSITWRWCFWINVPIGGVALIMLLLLAPNAPPPTPPASSWTQRCLDLDPVGFLLIAPSVTCLLFALQYGGQRGNWSQGRVIALFVVFGVLLITFAIYQAHRKEKATIPPRIIGKLPVLASCLASFCVGSVLVIYAYYLPIWFQVVQGKSPQQSGLSLLPLLLSNVVCVVLSGVLVSKVGYYTPFSIIGCAILVVGGALISTWTVDIGKGKWIGYQIVTGVGLGLCLQQPAIAIQALLAEEDIPVGTSVLNFALFLGGSAFVTVAQTLLESQLQHKLRKVAPGVSPAAVASTGATDLRSLVGADKLEAALGAYNDSMRAIWYLALALSVAGLVASFGLGWKSVKHQKKDDKTGHGTEES